LKWERSLDIREVDLEPPRMGEVMIKMSAAGVCHSDLHVMTGHLDAPLPVVLAMKEAGWWPKWDPG